MQVLLVRHTSVAVPKGTCYGQTDVPLADSFIDEARQTLSNIGSFFPCDAVYSSPLSRAMRLAAYCGFHSPITDNRLMEMNMGEWEMRRYEDVSDPYLQQWYDDYLHLPTPHGESFPMLYARVASFLDDLKKNDFSRVAVFSHGGVIVAATV